MIKIPYECKFIFEILENHGYECFVVGGCVRDAIMGNSPSDWDFTTNALPDDIIRCFSNYKTIEVGKRFGTIAVVSKGVVYEITTYRVDGVYKDARHPDSVTFSSSLIEDLLRRDFTMNSIAYSPKAGIVDPFNGVDDINNKIIRCTGVAKERFSEDALRILRALRFSSKLNFKIEIKTKQAIFDCMDKLLLVHPNRIRKEFTGILLGHPVNVLQEYRDVFGLVIPEIKPMFDLKQNNPHHCYDVWQHTIAAIGYTKQDELIRLAVFFHDVGKPQAKTTDSSGIDHFTKHNIYSEQITKRVMRRFCYPNSIVSDVCTLVKYHDERFPNFTKDIKRILGIVSERLFFSLFDVSYADMMAQSDFCKTEKLEHRKNVLKEAERIIEENECYSLKQLRINGHDLVELGYKDEEIGIILKTLLKMVIKGTAENTRESLENSIKFISLPR